jgi:hypothetical protein
LHTQRFSLVALPLFVITFSTVFTRSQISSFFLPPADCAALREPAGIARHAELKQNEPDEYSGKPGTARGWPLPTP